MLKFEEIECVFFSGNNGLELFKQNPVVLFKIKAPIYWWVDIDWIKYYFDMPLSDFEFSQDGWDENLSIIRIERLATQNPNLSPRELMQILPLGTIMTGTIELSYQEIIEVCENYVAGEYTYVKGYGFPDEREWKDFCETLLDIKGVRDLVKEEI